MKKRIVCLTLALMMTATQVVSVSASREDELREEQAATSAQLDATYAQIDQLYSAKQQLQDEINSLDANLVNVMVSIQTLEGISVIKKQTFSRHRLICRSTECQRQTVRSNETAYPVSVRKRWK